MKNLILSLAAILVMNTAINAQNGDNSTPNTAKTSGMEAKNPEMQSQKDAGRAERKLGLDATQKAQWQAASLERINANQPLKAQLQATNSKPEKQKIVSQIRDNQKKFDDRVNGFLTADQKIKWEAFKKEKKDMRRGRMGDSGQAPVTN